MDVFIPVGTADLPLLPLCVESLELYYADLGTIFVAYGKGSDPAAIDALGAKVRAIDEIELSGFACPTGHQQQQLAKLTAHRVVDSDLYFCVDADFLFVNPFSDADLMPDGRLVWYTAPWNAYNQCWRTPAEAFVGFQIPECLMIQPPWILARDVLNDFWSVHDIKAFGTAEATSEFICYAAFTRKFRPARYNFASLTSGVRPISRMINQTPDRLIVDPRVTFGDDPDVKICQFWSHWHLTRSLMDQFLSDSAVKNGLHRKTTVRAAPARSISFPLARGTFAEFDGVSADGWSQPSGWFVLQAPAEASLTISMETPPHLQAAVSEPAVQVRVNGGEIQAHPVSPGRVEVQLLPPAGAEEIRIDFAFNWHGQLSEADPRQASTRITYVGPTPASN